VGVSGAAAELLEGVETAAAGRAADTQRQLTQAAVGLDPGPLLRRLAHLLGGACACLTREGDVSDGPFGPAALDVELAAAEVRRLRGQGLGAASSTPAGSGTLLVRPIGVSGRAQAYLAVVVPGRPVDAQRQALTSAGALLSLAVTRRAERRDADRRLRERAYDFLVRGDHRTAAVLLDVTDAPARLPGRVRALRARGPREALADALEALEDERILACLVDDELVALLGEVAAPETAEQIAAAGPETGVGVGVATTLADAGRSHRTAGHAVAQTSPAVPVRRWEDLARAAPVGLVPPAVAREFAESFLGPLTPALRETLATFVRHHGSRGAVADDLGVHRNTVRHRVTEIETALGASLDDPRVRASAWIALAALDGDL
jgi:purine catabolism regulator